MGPAGERQGLDNGIGPSRRPAYASLAQDDNFWGESNLVSEGRTFMSTPDAGIALRICGGMAMGEGHQRFQFRRCRS